MSEPPKLHALFSPHRSNETELIAFLNLLLDNKHLLNIDALDDHGWTCLHHAVLNSYSREILNLLLVKGGLIKLIIYFVLKIFLNPRG